MAKVRFSLPDMARFEVTEANWVRAAGLATLGAAEAMSLEAAKRADIVMVVWGGERRIYNEEGRTRDAHTQREEEGLEGWLWGKR